MHRSNVHPRHHPYLSVLLCVTGGVGGQALLLSVGLLHSTNTHRLSPEESSATTSAPLDSTLPLIAVDELRPVFQPEGFDTGLQYG